MSFDAERFRLESRPSRPPLGRPLLYLPVTGSTNDDALLAARSGAPHGSVFVADEQTKGRGRRGNAWLAAPGESLLFSVLLRPKLELAQSSALTLAIGLGLRDVVAGLVPGNAQIKWPNDLYVDGKKLAGVLVESILQGDQLRAVVVGVGLNVLTTQFPEEIAERATSLALLGSSSLDRESLLRALLAAMANRVEAFEQGGIEALHEELNSADALRDRRLRVDSREGTGGGIDAQGRLLLRDAAGVEHAILSGTVELL